VTCAPPRETPFGTLCVLRRDGEVCVGRWDTTAYQFARPMRGEPSCTAFYYHRPAVGGFCCGWVFAAVMPEETTE
jgi:hypothetical protein